MDDIEDAAATLTVTGISGNLDLITADGITFGGSDADRWMRVTPVRHVTGTAVITITVEDSGVDSTVTGPKLTDSLAVTITVNPINDTPTINGKEVNGQPIHSSVTIDEDTSTEAISFTIDDEESGSALTVTAGSSNTGLVDASTGVVFAGSENNRTITVTPKANQYGSTRITIYVSDGNTSRNAYLDVTVLSVNDAPVVTPPAGPTPTINEDSSTEVLYYTISDIDTNVENIIMTAVSLDETKVLTSAITLGGNGAREQ